MHLPAIAINLRLHRILLHVTCDVNIQGRQKSYFRNQKDLLKKLSTKCDPRYRCDSYFITKCNWRYYKLRQVIEVVMGVTTKCDRYYKVQRLLQSATVQSPSPTPTLSTLLSFSPLLLPSFLSLLCIEHDLPPSFPHQITALWNE